MLSHDDVTHYDDGEDFGMQGVKQVGQGYYAHKYTESLGERLLYLGLGTIGFIILFAIVAVGVL